MEIKPFYKKKVTCTYCENKFTTTKIRSRFVRIVTYETDFKTVYPNTDVSPLYYNVHVCDSCGFAATEEFSPYFAPGTKKAIQQQITEKWKQRSFSEERSIEEAIETYKLAYLSGVVKKEKAITMAGLVLRLAWLYRDLKDMENEQRFITIARDFYMTAYTEGGYTGTQMSETRVLYMIGELSRRIGDEAEAVRYFSRIIEQQRSSNDPKAVEMAKDRWQEIRERKEQHHKSLNTDPN